MSHPIAVVVGCWILDALLMGVFWLWSQHFRNAGYIDIGWCSAVSLNALAMLMWARVASLLAWTVVIALWLWSLRLALYLGGRVLGKPEDPRFTALRDQWAREKKSIGARFFGMFQLEALVAVIFSLPAWVALSSTSPTWGLVSFTGLALFVLGLLGESTADYQLAKFRAQHRRGVCRRGLWGYSRHPNYFFEFVLWLGIAIMVLPLHDGWIALVCPALILFFLLRVTGIPATESHALVSRGAEYQRYRDEVSAFVPWFPRHK